MTLSKEDGQLYYRLWLPLLDYVNKKFGIRKRLKRMENASSLNPNDVKAVANRMYENVTVIDEYLSVHNEIPEEHRKIIESWKKCVSGRFIIERHLKKGSMLISMEDEKVYQVVGIISSLEEMFRYAPMPLMVEATIMPFKDVIITDGLIMPFNVIIGKNMSRTFKDVYMAAKKSGEIVNSL